MLRWRCSEEARDAFFEHDYFVFHAGGQGFALQQLERLFDGLMRQTKRAVMHGDHPAGLQVEEGPGGVGGAGMDVAELRWVVSADGQQREFGREAPSDFAKAGEIGGVSGVIE